MPTVREIAEFASVSKSTVSLVLNNKPGVSESMRRMVLSAQAELQDREHDENGSGTSSPRSRPIQTYGDFAGTTTVAPQRRSVQSEQSGLAWIQSASLPDESADTNSSKKDDLSIMVLHPPVLHSSDVFVEVLKGIQAAAYTHGVQLRLVANEHDVSQNHVASLYLNEPSLRPDGVLVFGAQQYEPMVEEIQRLHIPCVVLGRSAHKYEVSGLERDEAHYAARAVEYLVSLGHRTICFAGGESHYDYYHSRLRGYKGALRQANIPRGATWVQEGNGADAMRRLIQRTPGMTAVIFVNDTHAADGLPVAKESGLDIPRDLSVISFDDTRFAREYQPPLTSVSYNRFEEGRWAVLMLVEQLCMPAIDRVHMMFRARLIKRSSCAMPLRDLA